MKINFTQAVLLGFVVLTVAGIGFKAYSNSGPGVYDEFAQCLTDNGAKMYGADWCHNCQTQKKMFGKSFKNYIEYVQCDITPEACEAEGIEGYPTWKKHIGNTSVLVGRGVQTFETLTEEFSCELPEES